MLCSEFFMEERGIDNNSIIKGNDHRTVPKLLEKKMVDDAENPYVLP